MHCTQNHNSSKRHDGQLVRKLFQPEELSTVMHKDKTVTLHQKQTLQQV
jgi:hypothetical protein